MKLVDGTSGCFGPRLFQNFQIVGFDVLIFPKIKYKKRFDNLSWIIESSLVEPELNIIGFGANGHVHWLRKSWTWSLLGTLESETKSYLSKMKQNNSTEFLDLSLNKIYNKNGPPDPPRTDIRICPGCSWIFYRKSILSANLTGSWAWKYRCEGSTDVWHVRFSRFQMLNVQKVEYAKCIPRNCLAILTENPGETRE